MNLRYAFVFFVGALVAICGFLLAKEENRLWMMASVGSAEQAMVFGRYLNQQERYGEALVWFRVAEERGSDDGKMAVAMAYSSSQGTPFNFDGAAWRYRELAEAGDTNAMVMLALDLETFDAHKDMEEAKFWYQKAAEGGHPVAIERLNGQYDGEMGPLN